MREKMYKTLGFHQEVAALSKNAGQHLDSLKFNFDKCKLGWLVFRHWLAKLTKNNSESFSEKVRNQRCVVSFQNELFFVHSIFSQSLQNKSSTTFNAIEY